MMRGISVDPAEPWTAKLPPNVKFTVRSGSDHGPAKAFYNTETGELLHIVYDDRGEKNGKWIVLVHDTLSDDVREERLHRKILPKVEDELARVHSGDYSYATNILFEEEVGEGESSSDVRRRAERAVHRYMGEGTDS